MKRIAVLANTIAALFVILCSVSALSAYIVHAEGPRSAAARVSDGSTAPLWRIGRMRAEGIDHLNVAAGLSITDNLPATQGDFVTVPVIFNTGANSVTSLIFELHYDPSKLQATFGPPSGGQRELLSVSFPNLPGIYQAGAFVTVGLESDLEFSIYATTVITPMPLIPSGVLANLSFRAVGIGPVTTPITFETVSPPPSAGLSNGTALTMGVTVDDGSVVINPAVQTLNVVPGLNLVGLSVVPSVTTPAAVFGPLGGNLKSVFKYVNCTSFQFYNPTLPPFLNTLTSLDIQHGYWVDVNVTGTLLITGAVPTFPISVPLCQGSNLVAYPSKTNVALPGALNASITGQWNSVFGEPFPFKFFNPALPPFLNTLSNMGPGRGYWVDANVTTTFTVSGP